MENEMEVDPLEPRGLKRAAEDNEMPQKPKRIRVSTLSTTWTPSLTGRLSGPGSRRREQDCCWRDHRGAYACIKRAD